MIKYIILALTLGALAGYLNNNFWNAIPNIVISDQLFTITLIIMLFVFGFLLYARGLMGKQNLQGASGKRALPLPRSKNR